MRRVPSLSQEQAFALPRCPWVDRVDLTGWQRARRQVLASSARQIMHAPRQRTSSVSTSSTGHHQFQCCRIIEMRQHPGMCEESTLFRRLSPCGNALFQSSHPLAPRLRPSTPDALPSRSHHRRFAGYRSSDASAGREMKMFAGPSKCGRRRAGLIWRVRVACACLGESKYRCSTVLCAEARTRTRSAGGRGSATARAPERASGVRRAGHDSASGCKRHACSRRRWWPLSKSYFPGRAGRGWD